MTNSDVSARATVQPVQGSSKFQVNCSLLVLNKQNEFINHFYSIIISTKQIVASPVCPLHTQLRPHFKFDVCE